MGFLLIIAVAFVAAEDIVELEPVRATFSCSNYNTTIPSSGTATIGNCVVDSPYCIAITTTEPKCFNDPCLKYVADTAENDASCGSATDVVTGGSHDCELVEFTQYCLDGASSTKKYCRYKGLNSNQYGAMTPCIYENLKNSSNCDAWSCTPSSGTTGGNICGAGASRNRNICSNLPTETYCKLNPHCYWQSSACVEDTCTQWGTDCDTRFNTNNGAAPGKKCVSFSIFDGAADAADGATKYLCVDPDKNPAPNKCYDLAENNAANHPTSGAAGVCQTYTLPKCTANEECKAEIGTSGPYADYYCGDALHTSLSFAIHAPAIFTIVLAVLAFLS